MCTQWRLRSTWASAQSDQSLPFAWRTVWSLATLKHTAKTQIRLGTHAILLVLSWCGSVVQNISNFFKHLSRELAENLSLKGNNHLLGSTNLLVRTTQFTKQILLVITSVSLFSLHKSVCLCDLKQLFGNVFDHILAPSGLVAIATWYYCLILRKAWWDLGKYPQPLKAAS